MYIHDIVLTGRTSEHVHVASGVKRFSERRPIRVIAVEVADNRRVRPRERQVLLVDLIIQAVWRNDRETLRVFNDKVEARPVDPPELHCS
jgi:hypothetical protein